MTGLERPIIYLITPGEARDHSFREDAHSILSTVRHAVNLSVSLIQIREKHLSAKNVYELALMICEVTLGTDTRLLVNDRADIAAAAGADGVQLTSTSIPARVIRRFFPKPFIIGVSAHTLDEVQYAQEAESDLATFGPVFESPGKGPETGLESLSTFRNLALPVLGLGGIDSSNAGAVVRSGCSGVAGIRAFNDINSLQSICEALRP